MWSRRALKRLIPGGVISGAILLAFLLPAAPLSALFAGYGYSYGGVATSAPDSGSSAATEDVFVRGTDNAMWQAHFASGAFTGWTSRGGG
jgi:hypothetical protein